MSTFDDLFGDMGEAYSAIVGAHLQIKAEAGNEVAQQLLDVPPVPVGKPTPLPGDVVHAKDNFWVWDSGDEEAWTWWSPALRESAELNLDDAEPVIWQGRLQMPEAAKELYGAVDWMLATATLCSREVNPKTNAQFFKPLGINSVSDLVDAYRV